MSSVLLPRTDIGLARLKTLGGSGVWNFGEPSTAVANRMLWNMASEQIGRQAHKLKVTGSNPVPATKLIK
jgi:hypothetical protein